VQFNNATAVKLFMGHWLAAITSSAPYSVLVMQVEVPTPTV
jgi:hypothetical protein